MGYSSCHDCHTSKKSVTIRQSDFLLCDDCENVRQGVAKNQVQNKKTTSGTWAVAKTPIRNNPKDAPKESDEISDTETAHPDAAGLCKDSVCVTTPHDITCCCFICNKEYHLSCVNLTRRPPKTSNWCCSSCKDIPSMIHQLFNTVSVLSESHETLLQQYELLKSENVALNSQLQELVKEVNREKQPEQQLKGNQRAKVTSQGTQTTDIVDDSKTSDDSDDSDDENPWVTVHSKKRQRKSTKKVASNTQGHRVVHLDGSSRDKRKPMIRHSQWRQNQYKHSQHNQNQRVFKITSTDRYWDEEPYNYENSSEFHRRSSRDHSRTCSKCGLTNHTTSDCHFRYRVQCWTCGEVGHKRSYHDDRNKSRNWY